MIDNRHRLRPEKIINGRASLFQDIKNVVVDIWDGLVHVFCFICTRGKKSNIGHSYDDDQTNDEQNEDQRRPLLAQ